MADPPWFLVPGSWFGMPRSVAATRPGWRRLPRGPRSGTRRAACPWLAPPRSGAAWRGRWPSRNPEPCHLGYHGKGARAGPRVARFVDLVGATQDDVAAPIRVEYAHERRRPGDLVSGLPAPETQRLAPRPKLLPSAVKMPISGASVSVSTLVSTIQVPTRGWSPRLSGVASWAAVPRSPRPDTARLPTTATIAITTDLPFAT